MSPSHYNHYIFHSRLDKYSSHALCTMDAPYTDHYALPVIPGTSIENISAWKYNFFY